MGTDKEVCVWERRKRGQETSDVCVIGTGGRVFGNLRL